MERQPASLPDYKLPKRPIPIGWMLDPNSESIPADIREHATLVKPFSHNSSMALQVKQSEVQAKQQYNQDIIFLAMDDELSAQGVSISPVFWSDLDKTEETLSVELSKARTSQTEVGIWTLYQLARGAYMAKTGLTNVA